MVQQKLVWLSRENVRQLADARLSIQIVRRAFKDFAEGEAHMPSKVYLQVPKGDFRAMPAYLKSGNACGMKWVNVHAENRKRGLPSVMAVVVLNDARTGRPLAIMDGALITQLRTAAASAVATRALARKGSAVMALIGCGAQAFYQIEAIASVRRLKEVLVWGYGKGEAERFCRAYRRELTLKLTPVAQIKEAVQHADIVTTITPSSKPLVQKAWVRPGTHINAIGADAKGKQELDIAILKSAKIVVDEITQASHGGEINTALRRKAIKPSHIYASIGEILTGKKAGRKDAQEVTVFDSTGLAIHDIAMARAIYQRARKQGIGKTLIL